jgi:hypothetical protein
LALGALGGKPNQNAQNAAAVASVEEPVEATRV